LQLFFGYFLFLINISIVNAGDCLFGLTDSTAVSPDTTVCPQYASASCCSVSYVEITISTNDGCRKAPDTCSGLLALLNCAYLCKPNLNNLIVDGVFQVCASFYDQVISACENVKQCNSTQIDCRQTANQGGCINVYAQPSDAFGFSVGPLTINLVQRVDGTANCFNSGFHINPSIISLFLLCIILVSIF